MSIESRKFTPQYNIAVIKLIKQKFLPLQHHKQSFHHTSKSFFPAHKQNQPQQGQHAPHISMPNFPSISTQPLTHKAQHEACILDRARQHINNNRLFKPNNKEQLDLKEYIQLFEKPIELRGRAKKESISFNLLDGVEGRSRLEPLLAINTHYEEIQMNQEERSIMNAKIRRKLNHKKIIDLAKRY